MSDPRPAATVVVLRDGPAGPEVFMVRRHEGTAFMGGAHVFPGGRVDAGDVGSASDGWCDGVGAATTRLEGVAPAEAIGYHVAAARELFEEAGVLLARVSGGQFVALAGAGVHARFKQYRADVHGASRSLRDIVEREGLRLALDALVPFAHWVTPPLDVRRFDTRFFVTRVPPEQSPAHDDTETTHSAWMTAAGAIAQGRRDEIILPIPTWTTLREIEPFGSVDEVMAWARTRPIDRREPFLVEQDGKRMLVLPGDPLHPERPVEQAPGETRFVQAGGRWRLEAART